MEHLNRVIKSSIKGLGANKTENAISKIGKALGVFAPVLDNFDQENGVAVTSGNHQRQGMENDMKVIMTELSSVFSEVPSRVHNSYPNPRDPLHAKSPDELKMWIIERINL